MWLVPGDGYVIDEFLRPAAEMRRVRRGCGGRRKKPAPATTARLSGSGSGSSSSSVRARRSSRSCSRRFFIPGIVLGASCCLALALAGLDIEAHARWSAPLPLPLELPLAWRLLGARWVFVVPALATPDSEGMLSARCMSRSGSRCS